MNTTFTTANFRTNDVTSGLSVRRAAAELLGHDGAEWEIRSTADGFGWELWHRKPNANKPWTKTVIWSANVTVEQAEDDIFEKVIGSGFWDRDDFFCGTDEQYRQLLADGAE